MPFKLDKIVKLRKLITTKTLLSVTCTSFLFYQTWLILLEFMDKNIVTNIRFTKNKFDHFPAITICYDRLYSFERVVKKFNQYEELYVNYTKFTDKLSTVQYTISEYEKERQAKTFEKAYNAMINEIFPIIIKFNTGKYKSYLDIFDNFTIPFIIDTSNFFMQNLYISFRGSVFDQDMLPDEIKYDNISKIYRLNMLPLESIDIRNGRKCFTFLSSLEPSFRHLTATIQSFMVGILSPQNWFPFRENAKVYIAIHSSITMPHQDSFIEIDQTSEYRISYTKIENQQSVSHAKCTDYDLDYKHGNFNMKSDCVFDCLRAYFDPYCTSYGSYLLNREEFPLRRTQLDKIGTNTTCITHYHNYHHLRQSCTIKCADHCHQEYYLLYSKQTRKETNVSIMMRSNRIFLTLMPSSMPNVVISHFAEMTFLSALCNFGGLVGMWLGISVLAIMDDVIHLTKRLFINLYSLKFKQDNNYLKNIVVKKLVIKRNSL